MWARVISAPANVLGRMSHLLDIYERQISGERRSNFHEGIGEYLKLYYAGRDKLPPDETNGNTPLVSRHEVAWYAWSDTHDARMGDLIASGEIKNMVDLCYQTLALAEIDPQRYRGQIQKNAERILSLQRPNGQWSMRFGPEQPEVEFQTGHALWALQAAGVPASNPQVAKAIDYLLRRQQPFGGWMDPLQSFENFRTPFRETQMAVLALSSYFPAGPRAKGWGAAAPARLSSDPVEVLQQLDGIWDPVTDGMRAQIRRAAASPDALIRQAAAEALGRLGGQDAALLAAAGRSQQDGAADRRMGRAAVLQPASGDLVGRTDRRARIHGRPDAMGRDARVRATFCGDRQASGIRRRPGETRRRPCDVGADAGRQGSLAVLVLDHGHGDEGADRGHAARRDGTAATGLGGEQPARTRSTTSPTRTSAISTTTGWRCCPRPRIAIGRFGGGWPWNRGWRRNSPRSWRRRRHRRRRGCCGRSPSFRCGAATSTIPRQTSPAPAPPVYNRIGNDIEQIAFFGESGARIARALSPLLDEPDAEMRRLAAEAALLVRDVRFGDVNRIAGPSSPEANGLSAKMERIPEAVEALRILKPPPPPAGAATGPAARATRRLDEAFFRGYVEPILTKRGRDGYACVHCHATHTLFNGTFSTALNVVDQADPENSLILRKPTSSSETEGVAGSATLAHGGGIRFTKDSPEYATILEWIKGAER